MEQRHQKKKRKSVEQQRITDRQKFDRSGNCTKDVSNFESSSLTTKPPSSSDILVQQGVHMFNMI